MFWEPGPEYKDFFSSGGHFENPLSLEVGVDPGLNNGANLLCVYTGTLILSPFLGTDFKPLKQTSDAWSRGVLSYIVPTPRRIWTFLPPEGVPQTNTAPLPGTVGQPITYFHGGTVVLSLASIFNRFGANNAGWAMDGAHVRALGNQDIGLKVEAALAIRDSDGHLYRLSYQVTALGQADPLPIGGASPT